MIQSQRYLKSRIRSVESIRKLTKAMQMVSSAKLRPVQQRFASSTEYFSKLDSMLNNILVSFDAVRHPLLEKRQPAKQLVLCVISSDTGLCGVYNHRIISTVENFINKNKQGNVSLVTIGKKAFIYFKKTNIKISDAFVEIHGRYSKEILDKITKNLINLFLEKKADEIYIAYTRFESAARQKPTIEKILNIEPQKGIKAEYIQEPGIEETLDNLLPLYLSSKIKMILLNAFTAEHTSRIIAMEEATENAKELVEGLILQRNKTRQADITREIIEIISSANALKG